MPEREVTEYLCVRINGEAVAVPTDKVQEVYETSLYTPLPGGPACILGLINVRGNILPVLDLWEIAEKEPGRLTVVILNTQEGMVGLLISALIDLHTFELCAKNEHPSPSFGTWASFFPTRTETDEAYQIMDVEKLIEATLPQQIRQVDL